MDYRDDGFFMPSRGMGCNVWGDIQVDALMDPCPRPLLVSRIKTFVSSILKNQV